MVFVVEVSTSKILHKCDAWHFEAVGAMENWATNNGYTVLTSEITSMGDMVIWVE